jgi:hypothetical protein
MKLSTFNALPPSAREDVQEFLGNNPRKFRGKAPNELEPNEFFECYLEWNGIRGWASSLIELVEALGWKL